MLKKIWRRILSVTPTHWDVYDPFTVVTLGILILLLIGALVV